MIIYEYTEEESRELEEYYNNWLERAEKCRREQDKPGSGPIVELMREYDARTAEIDRRACKRQFMELGDDYERILDDARKQTPLITRLLYDEAIKCKEKGITDLDHYLVETESGCLLDIYEAIKEVELRLLEYHFAYFKGDRKATAALRAAIREAAEDCDFIYNYEKRRQDYRTESKAKKAGAITEGPKSLIIPTMTNYQYSMSLYQGGNAYLQPLSSMENLQFKEGKLYFSDVRAREVSEAELRDLRTKEGIEELDLKNLRYYYSILFDQFQRSEYKVLQDIIVVAVPLLAGRKNPTESDINAVIKNLQSYHNVMGVVKSPWNGKMVESFYQVLNFEYYDKTHNIVAFSSPYMNYVIQKMYNLSVKQENGKTKLVKSDKPLTLPLHSYLIDESIRKERNKVAVENVIIIVTLIEQAGNNEPHIKASTLIERNIQLAERLEATKNARLILNRTFKRTWELLRTKTFLTDVYEGIELPDPEDPAFLPTMKTLDKIVFKFPHKGKKKG